jgi:hypothetical protein
VSCVLCACVCLCVCFGLVLCLCFLKFVITVQCSRVSTTLARLTKTVVSVFRYKTNMPRNVPDQRVTVPGSSG